MITCCETLPPIASSTVKRIPQNYKNARMHWILCRKNSRSAYSFHNVEASHLQEPHDHRFLFGRVDRQISSFHSTVLPNLQISLYRALTTFETGISPWMYPSEWLDANMKHIRSVFDEIVGSTENAEIEAMPFPASPIFQVC